ncbi:hypothetical protein ARMGADRAFT_480606 [Armillaria gallica]|uniref:Uncharacterized protein n=1 Tax=Armillaria gallica TaxID=47427 RepID=A0A2H3CYA6_ARMGA|nr:hypothetical protein ARMGADRAFT_480606 [Armillaria gallica]
MIVKAATTGLVLSQLLPGRHGPEVILRRQRIYHSPCYSVPEVIDEEATITVQKQRPYIDKKPVIYDIIHSR